MTFPDAPDDGTTPKPTTRRLRPSVRKRPLSTNPRAVYWREWKRKKAKEQKE